MSTAAKLSQHQKWVLQVLLERTRAIEKRGDDFAISMLRIWGVRWRPAKWHAAAGEEWTPAYRSSLSRAARRLEKRGLIIRQSANSGTPDSGKARTDPASLPPLRCDHILLTASGRQMAEALEREENG